MTTARIPGATNRGLPRVMTNAQVEYARKRMAIRRRALAIARRHSDKLIARELRVNPNTVRNVMRADVYKDVAWSSGL